MRPLQIGMLTLLTWSVACGTEDGPDGNAGASSGSTSSGASASGGTSSGGGTSGGGASSGGTSEGGASSGDAIVGGGTGRFDSCAPPAAQAIGAGDQGTLAGVGVLDVEVNQGVGIHVFENGAVIPAAGRPAPLLVDRPAMFRARWTQAEGEPRNVEARLIVRNGNSEYVFTEQKSVSGESNWTDAFFSWVVPRCLLRADTSWAINLFDASATTPHANARVPSTGAQALEPWPDRMELKAVFVPIIPTRGEGANELCGDDPPRDVALTGERAEDFRAYLTSLFPVQDVQMIIKEPMAVNWGLNCDEEDLTKTRMRELRAAEARGDNWYYQALVPFDPGWSGSAPLVDDSREGNRISWAEFWDYLPLLSAHEIIHNHGVNHENILIDAWGWGPYDGPYPFADRPRLGTLKAPNDKYWDIMNMQATTMWINTKVYSTVAARVRTLTSWDAP